ncbi:MAG: hypothetical protein ACO1RA_18515 [Planctomycetaceae bacterium]
MFLRWRPRFSLGLLLYAISLFSIGFALYLSRKELKVKRIEAEALRVQCGLLTINNKKQPQLIRVKDSDEHTFQWRLYLPSKSRWELVLATDGIPQTGEMTGPVHRHILTPTQSEFILRIQFLRQTDGTYAVTASYPGGQTTTPVSAECAKWLDPQTPRRTSTSNSMGGGPEDLRTGKLNELMRLRVSTSNGMPDEKSYGGLLIGLTSLDSNSTSP